MKIVDFVNGRSLLLGVTGNPLEHSISPQLHNTLTSILNNNCIYVPLRIDEEDFDEAIKGLCALGFTGFNVTIPYKNKILKHLDVISKEAELIGAVNTVKIKDNKLYGFNTDVSGFSDAFKEESGGDFFNKKVVILGAGGAARAVGLAVAAGGASRIYIVNRTFEKTGAIKKIIKDYDSGVDVICRDSINFNISKTDIVINTTSAGMYPDVENMPFEGTLEFDRNMTVYDLIYNPSNTKLLKQAAKSGAKTVNGLGMLIYQGIRAYEIWMDIKIEDDISREMLLSFKKYL